MSSLRLTRKFNAGQLRLNKRLSKGISFAPTISTRTPSTTPDRWAEHRPWWRRTGRTSPPKKVTPASTCATRSAALISTSCPSAKTNFWVTKRRWLAYSGRILRLRQLYLSRECSNAGLSGYRDRRGNGPPQGRSAPIMCGHFATAGGGSKQEWFNTAAFAATLRQFDQSSLSPTTAMFLAIPHRAGNIQNNMALSKTMQFRAACAAWSFAPRQTTSSTPCSTRASDTNLASPSCRTSHLSRRHAFVPVLRRGSGFKG